MFTSAHLGPHGMHDRYGYSGIYPCENLFATVGLLHEPGFRENCQNFAAFFFFFFLSIDAKIVNNKRSGTSGPTRTEESYCEIQAVKESME